VVNLYGFEIGPVRLEAGSIVIPIAVIGVVYVPYLARPLRGEVLVLREQPFVEAARACGRQVFPQEGYVPLREDPLQWAWHLLLPWTAAALPFAGAYVQFVRASLLQTADQDWVRTARAKGLSEKRVIRRHVLRNGLIPPVNLWGLDFSHAFGGFALYVEVIFDLPGIGQLTAQTMGGLDLPPIVALTVYLTIVVVLVSAIVDVVIAWLDPRIRRAGLPT
jgi:peptide/nickel transport system permease protein